MAVILDVPLRPGDALPSERDLAAQFGVSRTVIREALRSIAGKGVVEMGQGRGLRVARVDPSFVRESMVLFLQGRPALDYVRVHEVRALLETEVAGLAAERATDADLGALRDACQRLSTVLADARRAADADIAFHRLLARATHNELFTVLLDAINAPLIAIRVETFENVSHRSEIALEAHRAILKEVSGRNAGGARAAMSQHIDDVLDAWRRVRTPTDEGQSPVSEPFMDPAADGFADGTSEAESVASAGRVLRNQSSVEGRQ